MTLRSPEVDVPAPDMAGDDQPIVRRLGTRLEHLYRWALEAGPFDDIWDLCCDHGRLGLHLHRSLLERGASSASRVHLVDRVPKIVHELESRYRPLIGPRLTVRCLDAGDIVLPDAGRQLILLAGVGGGTMVDMLAKLLRQMAVISAKNPEAELEFMLSPNLHMFELRRFLRQQNIELIREEFVTEKGRSHEHLHLRYRLDLLPSELVHPVGSEIWLPLTDDKQRYIEKLLEHYENCRHLTSKIDAEEAIPEYNRALKNAGGQKPR